MTKLEEISSIELRLKEIFLQDSIRAIDITESKELFNKWKVLTEYISDKTPVLIHTSDNIRPILNKKFKTKQL